MSSEKGKTNVKSVHIDEVLQSAINSDPRVTGGASFRLCKVQRKKTVQAIINESTISKYAGFLLDMDGVLHKNGVAIKGAGDFLLKLREFKCPFILLTNECRYTNEELSERLVKILGNVSPSPEEIYSSANSTKDFFERLIQRGYEDSVYVIGESGLYENLKSIYRLYNLDKGRVLWRKDELGDLAKVSYVVVGSVFEENTRFVEKAAFFIKKGARLVYTCPDMYDTSSNGSLKFGMPMSTINLLEESCNVTSYNLGKPNPHMLRMAASRLMLRRNIKWREILFVGDSLNTDIRTAIENGLDSVLLMSGCTSVEQLGKSPLRPNYVFPTINELGSMFFCCKTNSMEIEDEFNYKD